MPDGLIIRAATAGDLPAVARIDARDVLDSTASFELTAPEVGEMQARFATLRAAGRPSRVALIDAQAVGYAYAGATRSRPAYGDSVENSGSLDRAWRGRGIGGALRPSLIERCEAGPWRQRAAVIGDGHRRVDGTASALPRRADRHAEVGRLHIRPRGRFGADAARPRPRGSHRAALSAQRARMLGARGAEHASRVPTRTIASITGTSSRPSGVSA